LGYTKTQKRREEQNKDTPRRQKITKKRGIEIKIKKNRKRKRRKQKRKKKKEQKSKKKEKRKKKKKEKEKENKKEPLEKYTIHHSPRNTPRKIHHSPQTKKTSKKEKMNS